jgi:uncharacterized integral membrane protein
VCQANASTPSASTSCEGEIAVRHRYTQWTALAVTALILAACVVFAVLQG